LESAKDVSYKHNDDKDGPSKDINLMDIYWVFDFLIPCQISCCSKVILMIAI